MKTKYTGFDAWGSKLDQAVLNHLLLVNRTQTLLTILNGRLFEGLTGAQFAHHSHFLKLLFEAFEGLIDRLIVFDVNFNHEKIS